MWGKSHEQGDIGALKEALAALERRLDALERQRVIFVSVPCSCCGNKPPVNLWHGAISPERAPVQPS